MIALRIALALLIFHFSMSLVAHAGIFTVSPLYYEGEYGEAIQAQTNTSLEGLTEEQGSSYSMGALNVIFSGITFNWIYQYVPYSVHSEFGPLVLGLNIIMAFIISVAVIEVLWTKRKMM